MGRKIVGVLIGLGVLTAIVIPFVSDSLDPITEENFAKIREGMSTGELIAPGMRTWGELHPLLGGAPDYIGLLKDPAGGRERRDGVVYFNHNKTRQIRVFSREGVVESAHWITLAEGRDRPTRQGSARDPLTRNTEVTDGWFTVTLLDVERPDSIHGYYWRSGTPWTFVTVRIVCDPNPDDSCLLDPEDFRLVDSDDASHRGPWSSTGSDVAERIADSLLPPIELSGGESTEGRLLFAVSESHPAILRFRESFWIATK